MIWINNFFQKIKDEVSSEDEEGEREDAGGDKEKDRPSTKKKNARAKKDKRVRVENPDDVAGKFLYNQSFCRKFYKGGAKVFHR